MAGRGAPPKDPSRRARSNSDPVPLRVITAIVLEQPELPPLYLPDIDGKLRRIKWPARTAQWWQMWADSPLSAQFTSTDWSELMDTARLHALFWMGETKVAPELRLRVAKFGATPEDRARLRITFAQADEAESKPGPTRPSARDRRGPLTALPGGKAPVKRTPRRAATGH